MPTPPADLPPQPATPAPRAPPPLDTSVPPPTLPKASRERMRACALEWQELKKEGRTERVLWRDFAAECLTR